MTSAVSPGIQNVFKQVKVPLKTINAIGLDGSYLLKYRIVSDDGTQKSHLSPIYKIFLPMTISEILGFAKPIVSSYLSSNATAISSSPSIPSAIVASGTSNKVYTYSWQLFDHQNSIVKNFDVYFRWKISGVWTDWVFAGTTPNNSFSVSKYSDSTNVQGAISASTYTKSTLIHQYSNVLLSISQQIVT